MMALPIDRPSMAELASIGGSEASARGLRCPACGSVRWRVIKTVRSDGIIQRRRECQDCRHRLTSVESF